MPPQRDAADVEVVLGTAESGSPTGGHHDGLCTFRWFWPQGDPSPSTRVVKLSEVESLLPADAPRVDAEARAREIRERKRHLIWRFRT